MKSSIDTNVISAIWTNQPEQDQARALLRESLSRGALVICGMVYSELLAHPHVKPSATEKFLEDTNIEIDCSLDRTVWHEAGVRFRAHSERRRRMKNPESRRRVADFVIGSHALLRADRLITFNGKDFRSDFPELRIAPQLH